MDFELKPTKDEERKLRALSCTSLIRHLNHDQEDAIRAIDAAKSRNLWFRNTMTGQEGKGTKFSRAAPPHLFWPDFYEQGDDLHHQKSCQRCVESNEFFVHLGMKYFRYLNDMMESTTAFVKVEHYKNDFSLIILNKYIF
jgi:hypothetical protein